MIERAMKRSGASAAKITTVKSAVALSVILSALILPQIVHAVAGADGGAGWLPMYLPVIIGGAVLGFKWGLAVGVLSPIVSFLITSAAGSPMPALYRLPYMIIELGIFAAVMGAFSEATLKRKSFAVVAVFVAFVLGRGAFLLTAYIFENVSVLSFSMAFSQVKAGIPGVILQLFLAPAAIALIASALSAEKTR